MSTRKQNTRQRVGKPERAYESTADFKARLAALARGVGADPTRVTGAQHAHKCVVRTKRDARTPAEVMAFGKKKRLPRRASLSQAAKPASVTRTLGSSN